MFRHNTGHMPNFLSDSLPEPAIKSHGASKGDWSKFVKKKLWKGGTIEFLWQVMDVLSLSPPMAWLRAETPAARI